jgi:acyl-CoA thioester hydrolase
MYKVRVYYKDTDAGGVVYYGNYLRFFEAARTEFLRERGIDLNRWIEEGVTFVVVHAEVDYLVSARYNDLLLVETSCSDVLGARFDLTYQVFREEDHGLLATGMTRMACVGAKGKPVRIPTEVIKTLKEGQRGKR